MATSIAYLPAVAGSQQANIPKPQAEILEKGPSGQLTGRVSQSWWRFFFGQAGAPPPESAVTLGASPTAFKAPARGQLLIQGGTVSAVVFKRANSYTLASATGVEVAMSYGDTVTITYSGLPTVTWFPT